MAIFNQEVVLALFFDVDVFDKAKINNICEAFQAVRVANKLISWVRSELSDRQISYWRFSQGDAGERRLSSRELFLISAIESHNGRSSPKAGSERLPSASTC